MKDKYRILERGMFYKVESRPTWWPFWFRVNTYMGLESAEGAVEYLKKCEERDGEPWRVVKEC